VTHLPFNDESALEAAFKAEPVCAVVVEGMQGGGGIHVPQDSYWHKLRALCDAHGAVLIADEIQSGYGRSGKFFAHQHAGVQADLITVAKGMGNGFPIGGVLVSPSFEAWPGMLGTTFGGNHLACAAGLAVLDTIESEKLMENARQEGAYLIEKLAARVGKENVRGKGLMIGIELPAPAGPLRKKLLFEHHIFTGSSSQPHVLRLLPPLSLNRSEADHFLEAFFQLAE
jgi:acetylornithine/N-succinyldiaminopimelate aminotransferase